MNNILYFARIILDPRYWIKNERTDYDYNESVKLQLENANFKRFSSYRVDLNGVALWVKNYPYSYGGLYDRLNCSDVKGLSRMTIVKLHDAIKKSGM